MRDYLEPMLGTTGATIAQFAITLVIVAIIILIVFWLIRTFTGNRIGTTAIRGRQPRLSVLDALPVDQKRRLVLIRRDNVEHLILIGGPSDLVVEAAIHRPSAAQRRAEAAARANGQSQRYQSAPPIGEPMRGPADETFAEAPPVQPAAWSEPPRAEPSRAEPDRTGFVAPAAEPAATSDEPTPTEPEETVSAVETVAIAETVEIVEVAPEPAAPTVRAPQPPARPTRAMASFLGAVGRGRAASEQAATEPQAEPRRPEPPMRPLGRTTPVAPKAPEPQAEETIDVAQSVELPRAEPSRPEPARMEPVRPQPRPAMPPAPPVVPPVMGDEPYGAPIADPDHAPRFEPIFDINPDDVRDPGRPVRPMRDPVNAAPTVEPPREARLSEEPADETAPDVEAEDRSRSSSVGDLEKEMARLLGEISGSRRS